jgi:hypothetical protein
MDRLVTPISEGQKAMVRRMLVEADHEMVKSIGINDRVEGA